MNGPLDFLDWVAVSSRWAVGAVMVSAGIAKASRPADFATTLSRLPVTRTLIVRLPGLRLVMAIALCSVELGVGVLYIVGVWIAPVGILLIVLVAGFSTVLSVALIRGEDVECGCFGSTDATRVSIGTLARNATLLFLVVLGMASHRVTFQSIIQGSISLEDVAGTATLASQSAILVMLGLRFMRLRAVAGYISKVPPLVAPVGEVWEGPREGVIPRIEGHADE